VHASQASASQVERSAATMHAQSVDNARQRMALAKVAIVFESALQVVVDDMHASTARQHVAQEQRSEVAAAVASIAQHGVERALLARAAESERRSRIVVTAIAV
jgi:hypothetical protein